MRLLALVVTLFAGVFYVVKDYHTSRDIDAWMDRAQVAADREDMLEYLHTLEANLEQRGMTQGHFALVFKRPDNDLGLQYRAIQRIIERLEGIAEIPTSETAYQVALDDIRGTIREMPRPASGWVWSHYWGLAVLVLAALFAAWFFTPLSRQ
ncbi:hypothetical protein HY480_01790 [Candidatus Uhrbacteria bacterium]|nr:hypothetical protein [Candidatus Uhrbacteria bacterium]